MLYYVLFCLVRLYIPTANPMAASIDNVAATQMDRPKPSPLAAFVSVGDDAEPEPVGVPDDVAGTVPFEPEATVPVPLRAPRG
jgi:hypothetical protein